MSTSSSFLLFVILSSFLLLQLQASPFNLDLLSKPVQSSIGYIPRNRVPKDWDKFLPLLKKQQTIKDGESEKGLEMLKLYLDILGFARDEILKEISSDKADKFTDELRSAVIKYQKYFNLTTTGELDKDTMEVMAKPWCGVPATATDTPQPRWRKTGGNLTYGFDPRIELNHRGKLFFREAFDRWSKETALNFTEETAAANFNTVDFKIVFGKLDGEGGAVGAAYTNYSMGVGAMYLDVDELQSNMPNVLMHQIGHLLGLGHSPVNESIMYPIVMPEKVELSDDDRKRIQQVSKNSDSGSTSSPGTTDTSGGGVAEGSVWWQRNLILGFAFMLFGIFWK